MPDPFLRFVDVHKRFGPKVVLQGVNLAVETGETCVVLGGSGSGKSVLLRHAVGLHKPDRGEVFVDGADISGLDEEELIEPRKKVGMLFQSGALFDSMTGEENVGYALEEHTDCDEERIHARAEEVLGLVELDHVIDLMPSDLSGGMEERVALACAIALARRAILYDGPTTGLEPMTATTINALIRSLQKKLGVTSLVVTHDIHSAFAVGDRIAFVHEGRILFHGTTEEARKAPVPLLRKFLEGGGYA